LVRKRGSPLARTPARAKTPEVGRIRGRAMRGLSHQALRHPGIRARRANGGSMGVTATVSLLFSALTKAETFVNVFTTVYALVIFAYIIFSWLRLPYSPWLNRIQRFLYDVSEPYLRLFRRVLPSMGPLDLSPMVAVIVLLLLDRVVIRILQQFQ
jgi:YggT family protein